MNIKQLNQLKLRIVRVSRVHFYLALALAVQIVIYDAWALIPLESILKRWLITAVFFVGVTIIWLLARSPSKKLAFFQKLVASLIVIDVLLVSFLVYETRGMASRAVVLYAIPLVVAGVLRSRIALIGAAFLSIAAYSSAAVAYFVLNFNEGYTVELYGEVGFYSAALVLLSMLIWAVLNSSSKD